MKKIRKIPELILKAKHLVQVFGIKKINCFRFANIYFVGKNLYVKINKLRNSDRQSKLKFFTRNWKLNTDTLIAQNNLHGRWKLNYRNQGSS